MAQMEGPPACGGEWSQLGRAATLLSCQEGGFPLAHGPQNCWRVVHG